MMNMARGGGEKAEGKADIDVRNLTAISLQKWSWGTNFINT
jgi:hypothetical protein